MGLVAASGGVPPIYGRTSTRVSRARPQAASRKPHELIAGPAPRAGALAQAYLAVGAGVIGAIAVALPAPRRFNTTGLLAIQAFSIFCGMWLFPLADGRRAGRCGSGRRWRPMNTTLAVYFSGDSTSAFALFYVWVALYVFYFPTPGRGRALRRLDGRQLRGRDRADPEQPRPAPSAPTFTTSCLSPGTLLTAGDAADLPPGCGWSGCSAGSPTPPGRTAHRASQPRCSARGDRPGARARRAGTSPVQRDGAWTWTASSAQRASRDFRGRRGAGAVGALLEDQARLMDFVARSGGGEFALVLPETDQHSAFLLAEELLEGVRSGSPRQVELTASIGLALVPRARRPCRG